MNIEFKLCPKEFNRKLGPDSKIAISDDAGMVAFSDRQHHLVIYHRVNHRAIEMWAADQPFTSIIFTTDYLVAAYANCHQVLVFSLRTLKLKKKLTGHRSHATYLDFSNNRQLLVTQSAENCILWNSKTLNRQKTLNCSTSFFSRSVITANGQYLINLFDDGNVFFWELDTFQCVETVVRDINQALTMATSRDQYIAIADKDKIMVTNHVYDKINFDKGRCDIRGTIQQIEFYDTLLLIRTSQALYAGPVTESFRLHIQLEQILPGAKQLSTSNSKDFICLIASTNDILVVRLNEQAFKAATTTANCTTGWKTQLNKNPLNNAGCYCAGGFSNLKGCPNCEQQGNQSSPTHKYQQNQHILEKVYKSALISLEDLKDFSRQKLLNFLQKHHRFVDKHRAITYKYLLTLPSSVTQFNPLLRLGIHECTRMLSARYPILNVVLLEKMKIMMSLLAHYCQIFAQADTVPSLIFPIVSVLGQDELLCFETLQRFLTYWMQFQWETFPVANPYVVQNIEEIMEKAQPQILQHFKRLNISMTKLIWEPMSTFFSDVLDRQNYLSLLDALFCNRDQPQLIFFMLIAFLRHNRTIILNIQNQAELDDFLNRQNSLHIAKFLKSLYQLHQQFGSQVRYKFKLTHNWSDMNYGVFDRYPRQAVSIYRSKRQLEQKDYEHDMERHKYSEIIQERLEEVMTKERRRIQSQEKMIEAYRLRQQNQQKNVLRVAPPDAKQRMNQMREVVKMLQENIQTQDKAVKNFREMPIVLPSQDTKNEQKLDVLQNKLLRLVASQPPQPILTHLVHPMIVREESRQPTLLKNMMEAEMIGQVRKIDDLERKGQEKQWEAELAKAYKPVK